MNAPDAALAGGTILHGKYRVDRLVATGGMSRLYLGNPLQGAGMVAIKELCSMDAGEMDEDLKAFTTEYDLLCKLSHPSLPVALDFFEENGGHYLVEEFVPGDTLEARIQSAGRLQLPEALAIVLQLLDVLDYLHQKRIIYRDIKPSNIFIRRDRSLRLVDFGAARRWRAGAQRDTVPLGTPGFASPEHYGRTQTDERSDIYSTGAVLHYMLTGRDPAEGQPWKFSPPCELFADIPQGLSDVVATALELDPARRFQSVNAMRRALHELRLPVDQSLAPPQHPTALTTLRRRLQYTNTRDYYRVLETTGMALFGVFFFTVSIPAWFANVPLPHPLVGVWLTFYAFANPWSNWKKYRTLVVEVYREGMRVSGEDGVHEIFWAEVVQTKVSNKLAQIHTHNTRIDLDASWPGFLEVVHEVINGAQLVERSGPPWFHFQDNDWKTYERAS